MTEARIAFTVVFGLLLVWSLWMWWRVQPGSSDAFYARNNVLLSAAFLLTLVPTLIWPADSGIVLVVGMLAVIPFTLVVVAYVRRRGSLRKPGPPA
jgi:Ca2+/Na+ antiporter